MKNHTRVFALSHLQRKGRICQIHQLTLFVFGQKLGFGLFKSGKVFFTPLLLLLPNKPCAR